MPTDKFGLPFMYPTKEGGFTYFQSNDILDDRNFNGEGDVTDSSGGEWTFETDGPTSVQIFKNSDSAQSIGGCNMSFADTLARGYAYKKNDPRDIELTFLIKFVDAGSDNGFAIEGPTGRHSGSGCCQGFAYKVDIEFQTDPAEFRFRKEMWHVSNHNDPKTGVWTHPSFNFELLGHDDFVGFKYIHYIKKDGVRSGKDSVVLELWGNPDPDTDKTNWKLLKRTEDKGGWGDDGDQCDGDDDQIGAWSNSNFRLKSNAESGEFRLKNLSLREIDPTKDFDSTPDSPETPNQPTNTTRVKGNFTLEMDVNVNIDSACAPSGIQMFYNSLGNDEAPMGDIVERSFKTRVTGVARTVSSILIGKIIKQLSVNIKKVGSPAATPVISAKIWDADGNIKFTSSTTIDPTTLTTSFDDQTFDFTSNTYTFQKGDHIGIEWTGDSTTDYIIVGTDEADVIDSTNTCYSRWNNDTERWIDINSYDFGARIWE